MWLVNTKDILIYDFLWSFVFFLGRDLRKLLLKVPQKLLFCM